MAKKLSKNTFTIFHNYVEVECFNDGHRFMVDKDVFERIKGKSWKHVLNKKNDSILTFGKRLQQYLVSEILHPGYMSELDGDTFVQKYKLLGYIDGNRSNLKKENLIYMDLRTRLFNRFPHLYKIKQDSIGKYVEFIIGGELIYDNSNKDRTKGEMLCTIDYEDWESLIQFRKIHPHPDISITPHKYYASLVVNKKQIKLHRFLLGLNNKNTLVDHIDGDRLNNRRYNLRTCDNCGNVRNRGKSKNNKSGYKGVYLKKKSGGWVGTITKNRKKIFLGEFKIKEDAARAYNESALKYHGEFAKLNEI